MLGPRLEHREEPLAVLPEHLILTLELADRRVELGNLLHERGDLGLCSLRAGFRGVLAADSVETKIL